MRLGLLIILMVMPVLVWANGGVFPCGSWGHGSGGTCSSTADFSYTSLDSYRSIGSDIYTDSYVGIKWQGTDRSVCRVDFYLQESGDISSLSFKASVYTINGDGDLDTLIGTSDTLAGSSITAAGWYTFTFSSELTLATNSVIVVSRTDPTNDDGTNKAQMNYTYNTSADTDFVYFTSTGDYVNALDRASAVRLYSYE